MKIGKSRLLLVFSLATLFMLTAPVATQAAPIGPSGTFTIVGLGNVRVGDSWIDWGHSGPVFESNSYTNCDPGPNPGSCVIDGTTTGDILYTNGTGSFSGLVGTTGTVKDLEDDFAPVNTNISVANFLTAAANPGLSFTLNFVPMGTGSAAGCSTAPGAVCTPPNSPFTITNLADTDGDGIADNASVAFVVRGTVSDASGSTAFNGRFSTQIGMSAAEAIAIVTGGGWVESSHSADFDATAIPEPGTISLLAGGALMLLAARFRRRKR
jgi:hypothetical protein